MNCLGTGSMVNPYIAFNNPESPTNTMSLKYTSLGNNNKLCKYEVFITRHIVIHAPIRQCTPLSIILAFFKRMDNVLPRIEGKTWHKYGFSWLHVLCSHPGIVKACPHLDLENMMHATPYFREVILGKLPKITSRYYRATQAYIWKGPTSIISGCRFQ